MVWKVTPLGGIFSITSLFLFSYYRSMLSVDGRCLSNYNGFYSCIYGTEGILNLWQHTSADSSVGHIVFVVTMCKDRNNRVVIIGI